MAPSSRYRAFLSVSFLHSDLISLALSPFTFQRDQLTKLTKPSFLLFCDLECACLPTDVTRTLSGVIHISRDPEPKQRTFTLRGGDDAGEYSLGSLVSRRSRTPL